MRNGLIAAAVAAVVAFGVAYTLRERQVTDLQQEVTSLEQKAVATAARRP